MASRAAENPTLFDDDAEGEEVLQLDKSALVELLQRVRSCGSIDAVRRAITDLKEALRDPYSNIRSDVSQDSDIEFGAFHLMEELDQIAASLTLDRAHYYVDRLVKSVNETRVNEINDINLNRWKECSEIYLDSLWNIERRDNSGVHTAGYWGNFIPQIPRQMMLRYSKKGDWVLDTFCGLGTTLIEGRRLGRNSLGIELRPDVAEKARRLVDLEPNADNVVCDITTADSTDLDYTALLQRYGRKSVQLIIMHPPYFDIIKFSDDPRDLSNAASVNSFLTMMSQVVEKAAAVLDKGRYLALVIGDKYAKGEWIPLGFRTMNEVLRHGFILKSIVVKNFEETTGKRQQKELWNYRALVGGFYIFKHEYIFVFEKRIAKWSLAALLAEVPDTIFFDEKGDPDFNSIFVEVARLVYKQAENNFSMPAHDFLKGKLPNLSSFQRAVAKERQRRER